ncbi:MAG: ABC transporter substrate-binding protein [Novosphingobium sp.]
MRLVFPRAIALAVAVAVTGAAAAPLAMAQAGDAAQAPVRALDDGLLAIMRRGKAAGVRGRSAAIAPVIDRVFDLPLMTRLAVGPSWTTTAPAERAALVAALRRMTIAQYAANFDEFSGQSFTIDPRVEVRGTDQLIRTTLNDPKGAPVAIAYRLRGGAGGWKIIDVFYRNSISQLATRRSDFARVLASGGAGALTAHLNALAAKAGG